MAEYTQEQIDAMIADAKKGLFTPEDLERKVTSEVDRRVQSGIEKGIETQKAKWEEEYKSKANLTAEELAKKQFEEQQTQLNSKTKDIQKKANLIDAKETLAEAGIPKAQYDKFLNMLVSDDEEATKANVKNFIETFKLTKTEIETQVKNEFSKIPPPQQGKNEEITKETFKKMTYSEKLKLKQDKPEIYKQFMK